MNILWGILHEKISVLTKVWGFTKHHKREVAIFYLRNWTLLLLWSVKFMGEIIGWNDSCKLWDPKLDYRREGLTFKLVKNKNGVSSEALIPAVHVLWPIEMVVMRGAAEEKNVVVTINLQFYKIPICML